MTLFPLNKSVAELGIAVGFELELDANTVGVGFVVAVGADVGVGILLLLQANRSTRTAQSKLDNANNLFFPMAPSPATIIFS